ncbi:MAG: YcgN family cysteine cluster protein [Candidatus Thiodiazotropha sp. (ex Dulcina madagascariensis)]|nr:YcgN family cysteine cluster protein [Candidatus Thiodiazotropha sp. (ex Epidulcina cf. delphinae)]MCU7937036.1 YcgN family cysteine cluster protein [Candidatus Thiodiazotropha sp. (ex Dulcina madagascariensis)]
MSQRHADPPFWKTQSLDAIPPNEWESLCDGCAKCCLQKLEDEETRDIFYTNVVCDLLDLETCRCTRYKERSTLVPNCVTLSTADLLDPYWLPPTCAYRLVAEGKDLPPWHPLITGNPASVEKGGHSIRGKVVPEAEADDWEFHLIDWV